MQKSTKLTTPTQQLAKARLCQLLCPQYSFVFANIQAFDSKAKKVSLSTSKSSPEISLALGTLAGTEMGGFQQLDNDLRADSLEQLEKDFLLAAAADGGSEAELSDVKAAMSGGKDTAGNSTARSCQKGQQHL